MWGAEDYQARYERFKKLHAERRQQFDDYCKALKLDTIACIMKMSKDAHCEGQGLPETQWASETCQMEWHMLSTAHPVISASKRRLCL